VPSLADIASLAERLRPEFPPPSRPAWQNSPFRWLILNNPAPNARGHAAARLLALYLAEFGQVTKAVGAGHDLCFEGARVRSRSSFMWVSEELHFLMKANGRGEENGGGFDYVACQAFEPHRLRTWLIPAGECDRPEMSNGGWLKFPPEMPPLWLDPYLILDTAGDADGSLPPRRQEALPV
jgi:hypothetical protein